MEDPPMARLIKRLLHEVYEALRAYGSLHLPAVSLPPGTAPPDEEPAELAGPPAAHPERLRPDLALTPAERALERQMEAGS
jgi:hypothetical protein